MNLTNRPVYQKGVKKSSRSKPPTAAQRKRWGRLCALGCIVDLCTRPPNIHHCETGAGGRKDHDKVLPLCHHHHQGTEGIHTLSRFIWEPLYGTEQELMLKADRLLAFTGDEIF